MVQKIIGAQRDFSYGEVDVPLKRADDHPARKGGLRQMLNTRILNSGGMQERPGRRALFPAPNIPRIEEVTMSPGSVFKIAFGVSNTPQISIFDATGTLVSLLDKQGNGAPLPWSLVTLGSIVFAQIGLSIYITFGHAMRPQVVTWDGVSAWSIADYTELLQGNQKRTAFYRISPQGIIIVPAAQTGSGIAVVASAPVFTAGMVGTRIRFVGRQMLVTAFTDSKHITVTIEETLPGSQLISFASDPRSTFNVGDEVIGETSQSKGIVTTTLVGSITVQLLTTSSTTFTSQSGNQNVVSFVTETISGPSGSLAASSANSITPPTGCAVWDDEVMNDYRGYPASVFADQFRLGFCDFSSVPNGIGWSAINSPTDMYVGPNPADAMFEPAPRKVQVYYVVAGPEGSEFVFCDRGLFYIPISVTNPLKPGGVEFQLLSGDGCAKVQPRLAQEAILYANSGQNSMMAVIATGAFTRPYNTKNLSEFHAHLFTSIVDIAAPSADGTFNERYAYVLNADGSVIVGKYDADSLQTKEPVIGWGPWSGAGTVTWISAFAADVLFTTSYFGTSICEVLDDAQFLDGALAVNALPAAFVAPAGKGPLWFIPLQSVGLIDQGSRFMGTYQIDANGFIVPQRNAGEDLTRVDLIAGQPWTMIAEPFCPDAPPGTSAGQRMFKRRVSRFAVSVVHSTGFMMARLFSGPLTPTSPSLGAVMNFTRFPAWNQGDDPTKPPPQREIVERTRPIGRSFDPRVAVIKDTPGPLLIEEIGLEATI